ncbi:MAG TPA: UDP-N-acetylmuramoyl-L-alanine--D-glutamate ligase [Clostridiales bacterium UBA8960]|nr:UDP-N-acetylmuramoyl-L-alanine--D-glutamate ligase [Clostridiales bacterium UBA8960]
MGFKDKNIIVVGLAKSGVSAIKTLHELGAKVTITDIKTEAQLVEILNEVKPYIDSHILGRHPEAIDQYDFAVMSPGVPMDLPFIDQMKSAGVQIIGEMELAYKLCKGIFVGITGTNGKTTTTALTGEMFSASNTPHFVVGNIGIPAVSKALECDEHTFMVTEISSFQLETIVDFKAKVAAVLNLTPDHLNRHKTMENYIEAKARIFENQDEKDALVLNFDDDLTRKLAQNSKGKVHFFSRLTKEGQSAYIEDDHIKLNCFGDIEDVCAVDDMLIFGRHNEENALAAALISRLSGIDVSSIRLALTRFAGVEHRIEFTGIIHDRKFYNDSKGTNPDSTVCAIEAMKQPTHLIAGGYDKKSDYGPIFDAFNHKIKTLILMGETKEDIKKVADERNFDDVILVDSMEEAVKAAYKHSSPGDAILLSPACASWDMYENFEQRGTHFKNCVKALKVDLGAL